MGEGRRGGDQEQTKPASEMSGYVSLSDGFLYVLKWSSVSGGQLKTRDNGSAVVVLAEF